MKGMKYAGGCLRQCLLLAVVTNQLIGLGVGVAVEWQPRGRSSGDQGDEHPLPVATSLWDPYRDATWPSHSEVKCAGKDLETRSCHFENLVYDRHKKEFLFYPSDPSSEETQLLHKLSYWENFKLRVVDDADAQFPTRTQSCAESEPIYLTNALRPYSFGHTVRDFFFTLTANIVELDVRHLTFRVAILSVMPYTGLCDFDIARGMRVLRKYSEWVGEGAAWFSEIIGSCAPQTRFVVFRQLLAGSLLFNMKPEIFDLYIFPKRWGGCQSRYLQIHRDLAFAINRLPTVRPAYEHSQIKVLFGDKPSEDSRRINNIAELIPALQRRFPTFRFVNKVLSHLTAREQLEELSSTTIFISPHASSSFRMVYLPTDAHVIIIGPPEMDGHDEKQAFHEINDCWDHVPYFTVGRYHVTERSEYVVRFERGYQPDNKQIVDYYHWFDSDSHIIVDKMGDLIEESVRLIRKKGEDAAQRSQNEE